MRAAADIARHLQQVQPERGAAHLALSGGSTPRRTYELLAQEPLDWTGVEVWFADERCVGPDDARQQLQARRETPARAGADPARSGSIAWRASSAPRRARAATRARSASTLPRATAICRCSTSSCWASARTGTSPRCSRALATLDAGEHALCLGVHDSPKPPPRANHAEPRGAARGRALPAAGHRREQGRRGQRDARRAEPPRSRQPAPARAADGDRRRRRRRPTSNASSRSEIRELPGRAPRNRAEAREFVQ